MKNTYSTCNLVFHCYACNYCCVYLYMEEIWTRIKPWPIASANLFFLIGIFNRLWKSTVVECLGEELVHHRRCLLVWKRSDVQILHILHVWYLEKSQFTQEWFDKDLTVDADKVRKPDTHDLMHIWHYCEYNLSFSILISMSRYHMVISLIFQSFKGFFC